MSNVLIPFELFADLFEYFFTSDPMDIPPETEERIKEGLRKKAIAIIRHEEYAERLRQNQQEQQ